VLEWEADYRKDLGNVAASCILSEKLGCYFKSGEGGVQDMMYLEREGLLDARARYGSSVIKQGTAGGILKECSVLIAKVDR
jgi:hypothetical protein